MHFLFDLVLLVTFSKKTTGYNYWILSLFVTVIINIYIQQKVFYLTQCNFKTCNRRMYFLLKGFFGDFEQNS